MNGITDTLSSPDAAFVSNATDSSNDADNFNAIVPDSVASTQRLYQWADRDRVESAIPKALWDANVDILQGDLAQEYLLGDRLESFGGESSQWATSPVRQLLSRHENLRDGIWAVKHGTPYCKPITPNKDIHKTTKDIKYPNPPGQPASPVLPAALTETLRLICKLNNLDFDQALESIWEKHLGLQNRDSQPIPTDWYRDGFTLPLEAFWLWWADTGLAVTVTEGFKKALCLLAHGVPAIALRGITQWRKKDSRDFHSEIEQFATKGRRINICFDQDTKHSTIANVTKQIKHLGSELENKGCQVRVLQWETAEGKGIDDVLFNLGKANEQTQRSTEEKTPGFKIPAKSSKKRKARRKTGKSSRRRYKRNKSAITRYLSPRSAINSRIKAGNSAASSGFKHSGGMVQATGQTLSQVSGDQHTVAGDTGNTESGDLLSLARVDRLQEISAAAVSLRNFKRNCQVHAALNQVMRLNKLSFPVERETQGEYMPALPELKAGEIAVVDATMNSGKTFRIGRDWVQSALAAGQHVIVLSPLNSLGQQTAKDWGLLHIHDQGIKRDDQQQFWEAVQQKPGLVLCPDSIGKIPHWFYSKPLLLILDEANQVTHHICQGDTLKSRYAPVLEMLASTAKHAINSSGAIVLSEDGIPDRCVNFWKTISGAESVRCFRHRKQGIPWDVTINEGDVSGFRAELLEQIQQGNRILFVTASQREAKRLHRITTELGIEKVTRIDSETNEGGAYKLFFKNPDQWLKLNQPQVLILSPSAKSGVSIEGGVLAENAYFSSVWGYFPSLDTSTHMQLLGRYRPPVPRNIFIAPFILATANEGLVHTTPQNRRQKQIERVRERFVNQTKELSLALDLSQAEADPSQLELAILDYLAAACVVAGSQKAIAKEALIYRLEAAGHVVRLQSVTKDGAIAELWKRTKESIWQDEAAEIAGAVVEDGQDRNWAYRILESMESSRDDRIIANKVMLRDEFPGELFDNQEECYQALCHDNGSMRRGILLQARAENLDAVHEQDQATAQTVMDGKIRAKHRLPQNYMRAFLVSVSGVLKLLDGESFSNTDPRCIAVKRQALELADQIFYWLRLQIKATQSPVEICNKLLKKLGLKAAAVSRPGRRGQQNNRVYAVNDLDNPLRVRLLNAAYSKLSGEVVEAVSTIRNSSLEDIQIVDTGQTHPLNPVVGAAQNAANCVGQLVKWGTSLSKWLVTAVENGLATIELNSMYGNQKRFVPLSELVLEVA